MNRLMIWKVTFMNIFDSTHSESYTWKIVQMFDIVILWSEVINILDEISIKDKSNH